MEVVDEGEKEEGALGEELIVGAGGPSTQLRARARVRRQEVECAVRQQSQGMQVHEEGAIEKLINRNTAYLKL